MIRYISGTVVERGGQSVIVDTGYGVGYLIYVTSLLPVNEHDTVALYTHLAVRETALDLYGFLSLNDLQFFELLLSIPKIGPKSALQIMEQASVPLLVESITLGDATHLTKLSSIGKKTAEKIVTELKNKIDAFSTIAETSTEPVLRTYQDAFDTLLALGYNAAAIRGTLDELSITETMTTSEVVTQALKNLH